MPGPNAALGELAKGADLLVTKVISVEEWKKQQIKTDDYNRTKTANIYGPPRTDASIKGTSGLAGRPASASPALKTRLCRRHIRDDSRKD
jgi:hypothetical protein